MLWKKTYVFREKDRVMFKYFMKHPFYVPVQWSVTVLLQTRICDKNSNFGISLGYIFSGEMILHVLRFQHADRNVCIRYI